MNAPLHPPASPPSCPESSAAEWCVVLGMPAAGMLLGRVLQWLGVM